jgi:hypothetical protein
VSQTGNPHAERFTHRRVNRRTVVKIQGKVVKQGKRNALYRFVVSKTDKDKIAGWKQDFIRVLHVFNVRSVGSVGHSLASLAAPLSDRAGNRHQHDGYGHENNRYGYPNNDSKHVNGSGGYLG